MSAPALRRLTPAILTVALLLQSAELAAQELRPFSVDDALRVRSVSIAVATEDARWIAARITPRAAASPFAWARIGIRASRYALNMASTAASGRMG